MSLTYLASERIIPGDWFASYRSRHSNFSQSFEPLLNHDICGRVRQRQELQNLRLKKRHQDALLCCAVLCSAVPGCALLCCDVPWCAAPFCTLQVVIGSLNRWFRYHVSGSGSGSGSRSSRVSVHIYYMFQGFADVSYIPYHMSHSDSSNIPSQRVTSN